MMKSDIPYTWLLVQYIGFLLATTFAAGGGQYPGNVAHAFIYIKFLFLLAPILTVAFHYVTQSDMRSHICTLAHKNLLLIVFFLSLLLSLPLSVYPLFSLQRYIYTLFGFTSLFCLAFQYQQTELHILSRHTRYVVAGLLIILIYISLTGIYPDLRSNVQNQQMVHPNMLSSLCAQLLVIVLLTHDKSKISWILSVGLIIAIIALQSRGVWIALTSALLITLIHKAVYQRSAASSFVLSVLGLMVCSLYLIALIDPQIGIDVISVFARGQSLEDLWSFTNRLTLWHELINVMTIKQFFVGHGYALMSPTVGVDFGSGILYGAHNGYLSLYLGTGITCTSLFILTWIQKFVTLYRNRLTLPTDIFSCCLASFILFFTHALVAEEFGLHITPTFALLFLNFQFLYRPSQT